MEICCFPSELSERQLTSTMTASCGAGAGSGTPAGGQPPAEARAPNVTACELLCVPFAGGGRSPCPTQRLRTNSARFGDFPRDEKGAG